MFKDKEGVEREIGVSFPWLPPRCSFCRRWGHKGQDCPGKEIKLLKKADGGDNENLAEISIVAEKEVGLGGRVLSDLIQDLEAITPRPVIPALPRAEDQENNQKALEKQELMAREKTQEIQLIEPTTETFHTNGSGN